MYQKRPQEKLGLILTVFATCIPYTISIEAADALAINQISDQGANIVIDGFLDESVWQRIPASDGMRKIDPDTLGQVPYKTEIRFFSTEKGLYFGILNHQPADTLVSRYTNRDTSPFAGIVDAIRVFIDASGEGRYGYGMGLSLGDGMGDGSILPERQLNQQWDGAWDGRTQVVDDGWSAEFFAPWSMMPLPQSNETRQLGVAFIRELTKLGERWGSPPLPMTSNIFLSGFRKYTVEDIEPRRQLTIFPFLSAVSDQIRNSDQTQLGADIYWRPTTNTLLSGTFNPDFGTVESDDVVVNLTPFEVFFPERRVFFQEGQEIFITSPRAAISNNPTPGGPIALLNTRRIGGAPRIEIPDDVRIRATDLSQPTDLLGSIKFVGQNKNLRYGLLLASENNPNIEGNLADGSRVDLRGVGRDFSVGRLLYERTSNGSRRSIGWMGTDVDHPQANATVNAIDAHYFSSDQRWTLDGQLMFSDSNDATGKGFLGDLKYAPEQGIQHELRATYIDDNFDMNGLGFLARNSQMNLDYALTMTESDIPVIRSRTTTIRLFNQYNIEGDPVRNGRFFGRAWNFLNNNKFDFTLGYLPRRVDDRLGRGSGKWKIPERPLVRSGFSSNPANLIAWSFNFSYKGEDLGPRTITTGAGIVWRPSDRYSFDLGLNYTDTEALLVYQGDGKYTSFEAHQWAPKLVSNYFISPRQQFSITMQWNSLKAFQDRYWEVNTEQLSPLKSISAGHADSKDFIISRLTFQARYRWQIAPLSDLFIVYTRGSNLPAEAMTSFSQMFQESWQNKVVDSFALKLRYRFAL